MFILQIQLTYKCRKSIMKKMLSLLFFLSVLQIQGMENETAEKYGSLSNAFTMAQQGENFIVHYFDIRNENWEKKSALSRLFSPSQKISAQDMEGVSCDLIRHMRVGKFVKDKFTDYVVIDRSVRQYSENVWDSYTFSFTMVQKNKKNKSAIFIYNIADNTSLTPQSHVDQINILRQKSNRVIINIAKGMWEKMYSVMELDKDEDAIMFGEKPSNCNQTFIFACGGIVIAAIVIVVAIVNKNRFFDLLYKK